MPQPEEAQRLIEEHMTTLGEQKAQLERALVHLSGSAGSEGHNKRGSAQGAGAWKGRQAAEGGNGAGGERAPRGARRGEVIADLKANPGTKASEVATRVGINPNHAQTILGNLVKQGVATKEVSSTRWSQAGAGSPVGSCPESSRRGHSLPPATGHPNWFVHTSS